MLTEEGLAFFQGDLPLIFRFGPPDPGIIPHQCDAWIIRNTRRVWFFSGFEVNKRVI